MARKDKEGSLKKSLSLFDTIFFGLGAIIGAGIYAIIGEAAAKSGNMLWLSFAVAAVVAIITSISYAEFSSRFPDAGGSFEYIRQSLGEGTAFFAGIFMALTGIIASAAIAISFADYLSQLMEIPQFLAVIGILLLIGLVNISGIKNSSLMNIIATIITLGGLTYLILVSMEDWGSVNYLEMAPTGIHGILAGGALIFFSYIGFEDLVKMAEETKDPRINIPRAILIAGVMVLIIYLLVAISVVSSLDWRTLANSEGPLAVVMNEKVGRIGVTIITVIALFATTTSILTNVLSTSRLCYDMARDSKKNWLKALTFIPKKLGVPIYSVVLVVLSTIAFGLIGDLTAVASISNFFIFIVFLLINIALIVWRYNNKTADKPRFKAPLNFGRFPITAGFGVLFVLILLGYNIYNIVQTGVGGGA